MSQVTQNWHIVAHTWYIDTHLEYFSGIDIVEVNPQKAIVNFIDT